MNQILRDCRLALRQMGNSPGFAAVAVLSIALGIAGTAVVADILADLLRGPAGVAAPEEVHRLFIVRDEGAVRTPNGGPGSYLDYQSLRTGLPGVRSVATFLPPRDYGYGIGAAAQRVRGQAVSGEFFPLLGIEPARGRLLTGGEDSSLALEPGIVLSHAFWKRHFADDREVVGRPLVLDGTRSTVIGVAAPEFTGIEPEPVDLWVPLAMAARDLRYRPEVALFEYLVRLEGDVAVSEVTTSCRTRLAESATDYPSLDPTPGILLGPSNRASGPQPSGLLRLTLWLGVATAMLLLIGCANFANLLLARAVGRRRELAVRRALGAGEGRMVRQLVTESIVVSSIGGLTGWILAVLVSARLTRLPEVPAGSGIDVSMAAFAFLASLATGLLVGLVPSLWSRRTRRAVALNGAHPGGDPVSGRLAVLLVAGQVALAVVLLLGAGVFVRSLHGVLRIDSGLELGRVAVVSMDLTAAGFNAAEIAELHEQSLERLEALPLVEAATLTMPLPLSGRGWGMTVEPRGEEAPRLPEGPYAFVVGADFFRTTGVRLIEGRTFSERDRVGSEPVAIVSKALAEALAPNRSAVAMCVTVGHEQRLSGDCTRIVGVAENVRHRYLVDEPAAYVYLPWSQTPAGKRPSMFRPDLLVRTTGNPDLDLGAIRSVLQGGEADLPHIEVQSLESLVGERSVRPFRVAAFLLALFGSLALLLATIGLYGTLSQLVATRGREVGVRMALGSSRAGVLRLMLRRAMVPVAVGLAIGLVAAAAMARTIGAQMHGLSLRDPFPIGLVVVALAIAAVAGAWRPAWRAASIDPVAALRGD